MSKQDNLTEQLDNKIMSAPPLDEPINIVNKTPSKVSNTIQAEAPDDRFSSSFNNIVTTTNNFYLNCM
eukprot:14246921-Ditylum_brightwellii.AAC.2